MKNAALHVNSLLFPEQLKILSIVIKHYNHESKLWANKGTNSETLISK